jgi:4-hydroxy 2-oxovalerate aldolase
MMKLLDCTLRDGGYYTLWDFETSLVNNYCDLVAKLPIEYIEIGYRNIEKNDYFGEFYYSPIETIKKIKSKLNKSQKISLMLDAKNCTTKDITKLLIKCNNFVDLIRIATDPKRIEHSLEIAKSLKSLGFEVAVNIMYLSEIDEHHEIYTKLEDIETYVDYLYLVDSYGSIYPEELKKTIKLFQKNCNVQLGFHGHNNLELAFINTLKAIECGVEIIDSTILGMGRGAGNLKLELLLTHLKAKKDLDIDLNALSQLVESFMPLLNLYRWGTNLPYMVSGSYSLPQKDVMDAIEIDRYSIASLVSTMDASALESFQVFQYELEAEKCVIVGGGSSVEKHIQAIESYLHKNQNINIIHSTSKYINKFSTLKNKQLFCVAGDELTKLNDNNPYDFINKFVFEPAPRKINVNIPISNSVCELASIDFIDHSHDSPLSISLQTALNLGAKNIELVGFDGYTELKSKKELYMMHDKQSIISIFSKREEKIISLTKTNYKDLIQKSIHVKVDQ